MRQSAQYAENSVSGFNVSVPGEGLTEKAGDRPYEKPPQFNTPKEACDFILNRYYEPTAFQNVLKCLSAGVPIELIVDTIVFSGFTVGKYTVDVAELIKPPLFLNMIADARDTGIDPVLLSSMTEDEEMNPEDYASMLEILRPERYTELMQEMEQVEIEEPIVEMPIETEETGFIEREI